MIKIRCQMREKSQVIPLVLETFFSANYKWNTKLEKKIEETIAEMRMWREEDKTKENRRSWYWKGFIRDSLTAGQKTYRHQRQCCKKVPIRLLKSWKSLILNFSWLNGWLEKFRKQTNNCVTNRLMFLLKLSRFGWLVVGFKAVVTRGT